MPADAGRPFTAIILAAQRGGLLDPMAEKEGVTHKCLVPILGRPLLAYVLDALLAVPGLSAVHISVEPQAIPALRTISDAFAGRGVAIDYAPAADNIADSVYAAAEGLSGPIVITTADNVLLTPRAVEDMVASMAGGAEVVVALATREAVLSAHPEGQRRFYRFADASYSNCNLYGLNGRAALRVAESFRGGGQFAKNPKRIAQAFGLLNVLLLRFALFSLKGAAKRLSRRFRVRLDALVLGDGSHAVDVDNPRTYAIAKVLLERRAAQGH